MSFLSVSGGASPTFSPYRVVIADDHPIVRTSIRCLLESTGTIQVVAEAKDGEDAVEKIVQFKPDVALVDVSMPKLNGIEVIRRVAALCPQTRALTLTALEECALVRESLSAGSAGFIPKSAAAPDLVAAIQAVASGKPYIHSSMICALLPVINDENLDDVGLSEREGEILRLVAVGYSNKEIASQRSLSVKTVETYKARGMSKPPGWSSSASLRLVGGLSPNRSRGKSKMEARRESNPMDNHPPAPRRGAPSSVRPNLWYAVPPPSPILAAVSGLW